ncbi:unnamed protein product [Closterium sp. NIES-65]|nr:unnamed protein product [Closterium sp. NIES-65]
MGNLVLDPQIREWVLVPLTVVMILIGVLRHFVAKLMRSDTKAAGDSRAGNLRGAGGFIPSRSFAQRRHLFCNEENGLLHVPKGQAGNPQAAMFSDPNVAMDMMKKNLSMIIPQSLTFAWVNFFFSGFVAAKVPFPLTQKFRAKVPFPLTQKFRGMLQNGIDLSTVDVSFVSSRSWYFLNLFGPSGLFTLILGEDNATEDTQRMMAMQMSAATDDTQRMMAMQMGGVGADPTKPSKVTFQVYSSCGGHGDGRSGGRQSYRGTVVTHPPKVRRCRPQRMMAMQMGGAVGADPTKGVGKGDAMQLGAVGVDPTKVRRSVTHTGL